MNDQESKSLGRYLAWGLLGLIILVGASIVTSVIFFVYRSSGTFIPFFPFPFFPFHFGFLGIILLLFIILWVARWNGRSHRASYLYHDKADEIARERYAKGEITKEQFEQMMQDLKQHD
jgi:putative membrane protein